MLCKLAVEASELIICNSSLNCTSKNWKPYEHVPCNILVFFHCEKRLFLFSRQERWEYGNCLYVLATLPFYWLCHVNYTESAMLFLLNLPSHRLTFQVNAFSPHILYCMHTMNKLVEMITCKKHEITVAYELPC